MRLTTFTDITSLYEVIMVENGLGPACGAIYNPRRTDVPVPWATGCGHCARSREVPLHVRRCLQTLIASKRYGNNLTCLVPTNSSPVEIILWEEHETHLVNVVDPANGKLTRIEKPDDAPMKIITGNKEILQSSHKILRRCLRFLLSSRPTTPTEAVACLTPLINHKRGIYRRSPCDKIDWAAIVKKLREEIPR